ncbi:histamine H3 receptor [Protopterus annectens]|uniref:histamine H3 receptor n=1 Tax=Protopterus annectens TaxID=7888 RepID=UPI001CFA4251|nr:histamine H3 receptor [Protopterus annectens]
MAKVTMLENCTGLNESYLNTKEPGAELFSTFNSELTIALAVFMAVLIILIVLGNALVLLAFVVDTSLRTRNNYFLLNLAISDFLVGAFCIPLYIPYELTGKWQLGKDLCKLWLVLDYLMCTSSAFNIVLISYDRFLSVTRPHIYRAQQCKIRNAIYKMILVWVLAFLLYGPAIIIWEYVAGKSIVCNGHCYTEFSDNWYFLMTASSLEFFAPFISVTFFNVSIYLNIRNRTKSYSENLLDTPSQSLVQKSKAKFGLTVLFHFCKSQHKPPEVHSEGNKQNISNQNEQHTSEMLGKQSESDSCFEGTSEMESSHCNSEEKPSSKKAGRKSTSMLCQEKKIKNAHQRFRLSRDRKVAKSLAVIVCIFGICWAPYTLLMIIRAACQNTCVSQYWYPISFWLLWINSAINPVLYPLCHQSFKKAFLKLLCPSRLKPHASSIHASYK